MADPNPPEGDGPVIVWSTFPDLAAARACGRALVERRLAACVVMLPAVQSIYRWQGAIEEAGEVALLAKTRRTLAEAAMAAIAADHPYDLPALLVLEVAAASRAYGAWIFAETAQPGPGVDPLTSP
ncbi:divalent-cation tolerance protein CutA [Siculibacillus lacustris]|uniref:Divalent-cation tolerance protein CutA n=1 Tax=Siculibacillus lacustris TaxID=1549641 RepID=A0A4Q9VHK5_9HYPH|nr:divalent-cation tolerance protein CutA [Siculibacillus lacustris]TBW34616.1 divalent-cation tolerance protein CutA [Siculibacillus lacustris]